MVRSHISCNPMTDLLCRYYAINGPDLAVFTISIDGSTPQRVNATSKLGMNQRLLWSNTSLDPGSHTVTLTHDDANGTWFTLDFFRLVASEVRQQGQISDLPLSYRLPHLFVQFPPRGRRVCTGHDYLNHNLWGGTDRHANCRFQ
jgi:hypothetical protein